jgi:HlyD family secretion protein
MTTIDLLPDPPPSPLRRMRKSVIAATAVVGVFIVVAGIWSVFAPIETAAVAPGVVAPSSHRKTIQHLEDGIVRAILVHDGEEVDAGQTLIRLDGTKAGTDLAMIKGRLWNAEARVARLTAERDGTPQIAFPPDLAARAAAPTVATILSGQRKILDAEKKLLDSKIAAIEERIKELNEEIRGRQAEKAAIETRESLLQQELANIQPLVAKGLEIKPHLLELEREIADVQGRDGDAAAQIAEAKQTIDASQVEILGLKNDWETQVADDLRDTQKKLHDFQEQAQAAADVLARTDVRAPEAGIVTDLRVHTAGGVIRAGEPLLDLVPEADTRLVEVRVSPADIDRVHDGLPAEIRLLPYKERRTPPLDAVVTYVSADRLVDQHTGQAYYDAKLTVDAKELTATRGEVEMVPGMPSEAMIETGKTTAAIYALQPLIDVFRRAFTEK